MNANNEIQAVDITRTGEDFFAFSKHATKGLHTQRVYHLIAMIVIALLLILTLNVLTRKHYIPDNFLVWVGLYIGVLYAIAVVMHKIFNHNPAKELLNDNQNFLRKKRVTIDEKGLRETSDVSDSYVMWQGASRIARTDTLMLVYIDKMQAFVIPIRNFSSPEQANQFYENMLAYWHKAHGRAVPVNTQ